MNKKWMMMSLVACVAGLSSVYAEEEISAVQEEKNFSCPCEKDKKPATSSLQEEEKLATQIEEETDKFFGCKDCNEEESVEQFLSCKDCK